MNRRSNTTGYIVPPSGQFVKFHVGKEHAWKQCMAMQENLCLEEAHAIIYLREGIPVAEE